MLISAFPDTFDPNKQQTDAMANDIKWSIDPSHSEIAFKVRHLMVAHI
jgi:hypothetical protein